VVLNLGVPIKQVAFAHFAHRPFKKMVGPALNRSLKQAFVEENEVAQHIYLEMLMENESLDLSSCGLKETSALCKAMKGNTRLKELILTRNETEDVSSLAQAF